MKLLHICHSNVILNSWILKSTPAKLYFSCPFSVQAQLIHDRNTASHLTTNDKAAGATPDRVHMTWTKDKLVQEKNKHKESMAVKDMFNMKP